MSDIMNFENLQYCIIEIKDKRALLDAEQMLPIFIVLRRWISIKP